MFGRDIDPLEIFQRGIPFDGPMDVRWFENLPNASAAKAALDFLALQANDMKLRQRHVLADVMRMWKATFRACLAHGVPIPNNLLGYARRLGIVFPS